MITFYSAAAVPMSIGRGLLSVIAGAGVGNATKVSFQFIISPKTNRIHQCFTLTECVETALIEESLFYSVGIVRLSLQLSFTS